MSHATAQLLSAFDSLPLEEKQEFAREFFLRLPAVDSGVLDDAVLAEAGDQIAAMLDEEENGSQKR